MANFILVDGALYCRTHGVRKNVHVKPHVDARANFIATYVREKSDGDDATVKTTSSAGAFQPTREDASVEKSASPNARKMNTIAMLTRHACARCGKVAYPIESVDVDGVTWHKACFKCKTCACTLTLSTFVTSNGELYCRKDVPKTRTTVGLGVAGGNSASVSPARAVPAVRAPIESDVVAKRDDADADADIDASAGDEPAVEVDGGVKPPMVEITNEVEPATRENNAVVEKNAGESADAARVDAERAIDAPATAAAEHITEKIAEVKIEPVQSGKQKKKKRGGRK